MIELNLLKRFCQDRKVQSTNNGYIDSLDNLEREMKLLFKLANSYYRDFEEHDKIPKEELLRYYDLKYPKSKSREIHLDLIQEAYNSEISNDLIKLHLDQLIEKHHATQIINKLLPVMEGEKYGVLDTVRNDVDDYVGLMHNPPDSLIVPVPCETSIETLVQEQYEYGGVPWHLQALSDIIGGIRRKTLGLIYAYVGSGKTSFTMSAVAAFAEYLMETEDVIVYCGNEEAAENLRLRLVQAITNLTKRQIKKNPGYAAKLAQDGGIESVKIFDNITSGAQLDYILREYKPHITVVDQAPFVEVKTPRKLEGTGYLEALFQFYRRASAVHDTAIVSVAQAEGAAENEKYLKLSQVYNSRVGIQGALDWALGIGMKQNNPVDDDLRYLNVSKNKGEEGRFSVLFDKRSCHWQEV